MTRKFDAKLFIEEMKPKSRAPGTKVNEELEKLSKKDRDLVLSFLRNDQISAKRMARTASQAGLFFSESTISGWRANRETLDHWDD